MDHNYYAENKICSISPLKEENIECLRKWRNDKKNSKFLRPVPYITSEMEEKWFKEYLNDPTIIFFTITDKKSDKVVGSMALYNIMQDECEIGKIVIGNSAAHGRGIGYNAFLLAMSIGIEQLGINKFKLEVHTENISALSIYVKVGFEITGSHDFINGGKELEMAIDKSRFKACNPTYHNVYMNDKSSEYGK